MNDMPDHGKITGLGDLAHAVAHPVAKVLDAAVGTDLENCEDCSRRREDWNEKFPLPDGAVKLVDGIRNVVTNCLNCGRK